MGQSSSAAEVSDGYILTVAVREGHADIVKMYLDKKSALAFHVNSAGSTILHAACSGGQHEILCHILTSLRLSAMSNTFDPVTRLLDQADSAGRTSLALAAAGLTPGHEACVFSVLEAGASVWLKDQAGRTCLHHAALRGNSTTVQMLMDAAGRQGLEPQQTGIVASNANSQINVHRYVNLADAAGCCSLHYAMHSLDLETIHTLIIAGANLTAAATHDSLDNEAPVNQGSTPLHIAALKGDTPAAVLLLTAYVTAAVGALPELEQGPCACTYRQRQRDSGLQENTEVQHCHQECCIRASCDSDAGRHLPDPRTLADAYGMTPYTAAMGGSNEDLKQLLNPSISILELLEALPLGPTDASSRRGSTVSTSTNSQRPVSFTQLQRAMTAAARYLTRQKSLQEGKKAVQQPVL